MSTMMTIATSIGNALMVLLMQKLIKFMMIVIASMAADGLMRWWSDGWADGGADNPLMISSSWQIQQILRNV